MSPLANKLICAQFGAIAPVWSTWVSPEEHGTIRDDSVMCDLTILPGFTTVYRFTVRTGPGARIEFYAKYRKGEYYGCEMACVGNITSHLPASLEALGKLTTFMYKYLVQLATDNGFPAENIMM